MRNLWNFQVHGGRGNYSNATQEEAENLGLRQQHPKQQVQRDVVDTSTNFTTAVANVVDLTNDICPNEDHFLKL